MSATHAVSASGHPSGSGLVSDLIARVSEKMRRLIDPGRLLFRANETTDELIVARHGPVEIRQTLAGWSLETCVKGESDRARSTALRRLSNYVNGKNRSGIRLHVARPLVQDEEAAGRWRVRVALPGVDSEFATAMARNGRVRLRALGSETLAVIRVPGRPTPLAIQHAETAIRLALAPTRWEPAGRAMLRLHSLPALLPFLGRFEVALPIVERLPDSVMPEWMRRAVFDHSATQEAATQSSPPVR